MNDPAPSRWNANRVRYWLCWACAAAVVAAIAAFALGGTLLRWAVWERHHGLVRFIVASNPNALKRSESTEGWPILSIALARDLRDPDARATAFALLDAMTGAGTRARPGDLRFALVNAIAGSDERLLATLLSLGVRPDAESLPLALRHKANARVVAYLIHAGADPNVAESPGGEPVAFAAAKTSADPDVVAAFVATARRCDTQRVDGMGNNLLHHIAQNPNMTPRAVEAAVAAGVPLHGRNRDGATPMVMAFSLPPSAGVKLLRAFLREGASARESFPGGRAPLHVAAENGVYWPLETLVRAGAQQDAQDVAGDTPLHVAVANHRHFMRFAHPSDERQRKWTAERIHATRRVVETLVRLGADLDVPNRNGVTPRMMIAEHKLPFDFLQPPPPEWTR